MERWAAERGQSWTGYGPTPDRPSEYEARVRLWHVTPNRYRVERAIVSGPSAEPYTRVLDGTDEWYYAPSSGIYKNPSNGTYVECGVMLDPAPLLGSMRFGDLAEGERAGRACVLARAALKAVDQAPESLQELGLGADYYELLADVEHGVLLELRAVFEEAEMFRLTTEEVCFDEELSDELFQLVAPPGVPVVDARELKPPQTMALEAAADHATFTVLVPRRSPSGTALYTSYQAPSASPPIVERVYLQYVFPNGAHTLVVVQADAASSPSEATDDWASETRDGQELRHAERGSQRDIELERAGTRVRISSDLELETLLELALTLEPAATEPPLLLPS